jgi:uncharacterized membrane protein YhaH (DUF805 family)
MEEFKLAFRSYANFDGRSTRKEYWMYILFYILIIFGLIIIDNLLDNSIIGIVVGLFQIVFIIPSISVAVRRLHDVNKSGWFLLLSFIPLANFYLLYLLIQPSSASSNQWGEAR